MNERVHPDDTVDGIPLEDIAALIDGTLDEGERAELLARLGDSEAASGVFAEAALLKWSFRRKKGKPSLVIALAAAAVVALVALVGPFQGRPSIAADLTSDVLVSMLDPQAFTAVAIRGTDPLPVYRGASTPGSTADRAFRVGVRVLDFEALSAGNQGPAASAVATELVELLEDMDAPAAVRVQYRIMGEQTTEGVVTEARRGAEEDLAAWIGTRGEPATLRFEFGKRIEAVRLSVLDGDLAFLRSLEELDVFPIPEELGLSDESRKLAEEFVILVDSTSAPSQAFVVQAMDLLLPVFGEASGSF